MKASFIILAIFLLALAAGCTQTQTEIGAAVSESEVNSVTEPTADDIESDMDSSSMDDMERDMDSLIVP